MHANKPYYIEVWDGTQWKRQAERFPSSRAATAFVNNRGLKRTRVGREKRPAPVG